MWHTRMRDCYLQYFSFSLFFLFVCACVCARAHSSTGASACSLCPARSYASSLSGASSCTSCGAGSDKLCLLGAALPAPNRLAAATATPAGAKPRIRDPFVDEMVANDAEAAALGALIVWCVGPAVLVLLAVSIASEKYASAKQVFTCGGTVNWQTLDKLFRDQHFKQLGNHVRIQQTCFGAAMTIACVITFAAAGVVLGINNLMFPVFASSVSPQVRTGRESERLCF
jgi:hypothetical protein